ncbi:MAG: phenylalanine--tRNA ligase subunit beta [Rickettsiales bacterium]|jgi:phenylalanyl-tRNA synthetase beta chain|nr:phenylalanine--tRNA ligase subunit beta [Rickettsiales bacterium]
MKWTLDWLKDYLETNATAEEIADELTRIGLEIEELTFQIVPVVAKIVECSDIPDTHLHLLSVDDGAEIRKIVCGAPNVRVGLVSALARPGCLIQGTEIKVGKIRGHESNGMMCSEKELGLGADHTGIIELDGKKYKIGQPLVDSPGAGAVFDAKVLPNRPDYLAVRGIARDLSASGIGAFKEQRTENREQVAGKRRAIIKNKARCPVYNFAEIHGIKIALSSEKVRVRLAAIGINPKNAPVDATNYVCYDIGQPLHCFDADEINGDIVIRNAEEGERFADLFGAEHILSADDLVITDSDGILALAGVVGGARGMTKDTTRNIILEAAYFEPIGIRKTRRRLNLSTDASYRYERGADPTISGEGLSRTADLIIKECGGDIVAMSNDELKANSFIVRYFPETFAKKTGIELPAEKQREILKKLGYEIDAGWNVKVPSWRTTEVIPETLISDIIRIYGYDKIENIGASSSKEVIEIKPVKMENDFFAKERHLTEHISYGFGNIYTEKLVSDRPNIKIANPIADFMNTARNSLIPNMLNAIAENAKRGYPNLAMFEVGTVFDGPNPGEEHKQVVIARTGEAGPRHWLKRGREVDVYDAKADLLAFWGRKYSDIKTETGDAPIWAHPYRYGRLAADGKVLGEFGELHPNLARHWRIKMAVVIGLIERLDENPLDFRRDSDFSDNNFQPITRDFSFALNGEVPAQDIVAAARAADGRIADVAEFDFYEGSIAFTITIVPDKSLSDREILEVQNKVVAAVEKLGAKIRDK